MKKAITVLMCLLFVLTVFYPTGFTIFACFGYILKLNIPAFAVTITVLAVCAVVIEKVFKIISELKTIRIMLAVITPFSFINAVCYTIQSKRIWVFIILLVYSGCCFYLAINYGKPMLLNIFSLSLCALMVLPVVFFSFVTLTLGSFGKDTVVKTVVSPKGTYYAQVIDSDQGALGGDTSVYVQEKSVVNAIIFKIEKKRKLVYFGDWGEFENMEIYWKDDTCLVINSVEYEID